MPRVLDPDVLARAGEMLAAGRGVTETSRATGISETSLHRHFPAGGRKRETPPSPTPPADPPAEGPSEASRDQPPSGKRRADPPPRARAHGHRGKHPSDEQLEGMVRRIAVAPAIPAMLWLHCDFCANHFRESAGPLAAELVAVSRDDKDLRELLEWMHTGWRRYAWAGMLLSWVGVPLVHHAAPGPVYRVAGPLMGMPPRHDHTHSVRPDAWATPPAAAEPATEYEPAGPSEIVDGVVVVPPADLPFAQMLAGMHVSDLFGMAAGLGIQLPGDILAAAGTLTGDGNGKTAAVDGTERSLEEQERDLAATAAEAAAAQAAALTADPDAF